MIRRSKGATRQKGAVGRNRNQQQLHVAREHQHIAFVALISEAKLGDAKRHPERAGRSASGLSGRPLHTELQGEADHGADADRVEGHSGGEGSN